MKKILTYGGVPAMRNLTVDCIRKNKASGQKMTQVDGRNAAECGASKALDKWSLTHQ